MDNFVYSTPTKVYFGKGEESKVGQYIAQYHPNKVLLHYGGASAEKSGLLDRVRFSLKEAGLAFVELGGVQPNPNLEMVRKGIALCQAEGVDFVLAVGGGSVIDSAKDIANGTANPGVDVWDFSMGKAKPEKTLRKAAILTLSAAGSEMSSSCVITNEETGDKRGYGCEQNRMDFAIENPELTYSVSAYQTACGAVDIAMHTIERYFCPGTDTYLTDAIAIAVIKSVMKAGNDCLKAPNDYVARANMMWASSLAHNGLTQCGRSFQLIVHQLEHEVSGMYPSVTHGAGLAALWCSWARYVYRANINRWLQYASEVWNQDIDFEHPEKTIERAIDLQEQYYASIGMPTNLRELKVREEDLEPLAFKCSRGKTRKLMGDRELDYNDVLAIYRMAYHNGEKKTDITTEAEAPAPTYPSVPPVSPRTPMMCVYAGPDYFRGLLVSGKDEPGKVPMGFPNGVCECGMVYAPGSRICSKCGRAICECGATYPASGKFCPNCGKVNAALIQKA